MKGHTLGYLAYSLALLLFAPAPEPKKPAPAGSAVAQAQEEMTLLGDWQLTWNGCPGVMQLRKQGNYRCLFQGVEWIGSWSLQGEILVISERPVDGEHWYHWRLPVRWVKPGQEMTGKARDGAGSDIGVTLKRGVE